MSRREALRVVRQIDSDEPFLQVLCVDASYYFILRQLGAALRRNTSVRKLEIEWQSTDIIPLQEIEAFCQGLSDNRSVRYLDLSNGSLSHLSKGNSPQWLDTFARNNPCLESIYFSNPLDDSYNPDAFEVVRAFLRSGASLKKVVFADRFANTIQNETELFMLLGNLPNLENLEWCHLNEGNLPFRGTLGLANLLQNRQSNLVSLSLYCETNIEIANDLIASLTSSLERNTKLIYLNFNVQCPLQNWAPLLRVLRLHNHTLERLLRPYRSSSQQDNEIESLLRLNSSEDKDFVRFRKGLDYNYTIPERGINLEPLENEFEVANLPYLLASIGTKRSHRDQRSENCRFNAFYHFVKNKPLLMADPFGQKNLVASSTERKRKRGGNESSRGCVC